MADVARDQIDAKNDNVASLQIPGYEFNERTYREGPLLENVKRGQLLKQTSIGWRLCHPGERADGIALKWGIAGTVGFSIAVIGEMSGWVTLTPGSKLYPSAANNGEMQTDVVAGYLPQVHVSRPGIIRFNFTI